jgi:hypothetical protein
LLGLHLPSAGGLTCWWLQDFGYWRSCISVTGCYSHRYMQSVTGYCSMCRKIVFIVTNPQVIH